MNCAVERKAEGRPTPETKFLSQESAEFSSNNFHQVKIAAFIHQISAQGINASFN